MKYYFKSPQEIKDSIQTHQLKIRPYRNRTFMMIFADLALFLIILAALYFSGNLYLDRKQSKGNLVAGDFQYSLSVVDLDQSHPDPRFLLLVSNLTDQPLSYPPGGAGQKGTLYIMDHSEPVADIPIYLEERRIGPKGKELYSFHPLLPDLSARNVARLQFKMILNLAEAQPVQIDVGSR